MTIHTFNAIWFCLTLPLVLATVGRMFKSRKSEWTRGAFPWRHRNYRGGLESDRSIVFWLLARRS